MLEKIQLNGIIGKIRQIMYNFYGIVVIGKEKCALMKYQDIIKKVAKKYNTTADEVDREIRSAINYTGSEIEPTEFIEMISNRVKEKLRNQ